MRIINRNESRVKSSLQPGNNQLILVGVLVVAFIVALFFGVSIGQENYFETYIVLLLLGTPAMLFVLKGNYWIFIPFVIRCGLPAIPIVAGRAVALKEIWLALCVIMLAGQLLIYRSRRPIFNRIEFIPIYVILTWVVIMFFREGIGLAILGSAEQGGRKYVGIVLGIISIFVIAHQSISEKQCKWLVKLILIATFTATVYALVNYLFFRVVTVEEAQWANTYYTYHQILSNFPLILVMWTFSKYSPTEIIFKIKLWAGFILGFSYSLVMYSGKRMHFALALLVPVISAVIRRQYAAVMMYGAAAVILLSILIVGQGVVDKMPGSVERALSFVDYIPGVEWKSNRIKKTTFRSTLNEIALEKIAEHPVIGNGLSVSESEIIEYEAMEEYAVEEVDLHAFSMAAGSAWHNTWLGVSTDFGIPCAIIYAIFWLQMFRYAFKLRRDLPVGSAVRMLVTFLLIMNIGDLLQSWVAGHSLEDLLWIRGWQFGILLAIKFQFEKGAYYSDESSVGEHDQVLVSKA